MRPFSISSSYLLRGADPLHVLGPADDFSVKAKFPPDLRPVVEQTAKVALETGCYGDGFFDQMPKIFPYNRYTMMVRRSPEI